MKVKYAAIILLIASVFQLLLGFADLIELFNYYTRDLLGLLMKFISSFSLPVALLILSIALMNQTEEQKRPAYTASQPSSVSENNLSVGDWLVNFLIAIIPLVGFIFYIVWANDDNNKIRKNWAIASLIWSGILFFLSIFLYAALFSSAMYRY